MIAQLRERLRTRLRGEGRERRVRSPALLQMEAVECGAVSLAIILGYYGRRVPIEELRTACDVSRDGTKASNILAAARRYGLKGKGFRKEPDGLRAMKMPCILHWNFQHFLVLEGFEKDRAYLSDPASGRYSVTLEELSEAFTGVVLVLEPTAEFQPVRTPHGVLAKLGPRLRGSGGALVYAALASFGLIVLGLAIPTFTRVFVDELLVKRLTDWLAPLLGIMVAVAVAQSAFVWLQGRCLMRLEGKLALSSSGTFVWHLLRLPVEFFTQRYAGEIAGRVQLNDRLAELVSREILGALLNMVLVVFYLGLMLVYNVPLTLVTVGLSTLTIGSSIWAVRRSADSSRRFAMDAGKMGGVTMNGLRSIETLKAAGAESDFFSRWAGHLAKVSNAQMEMAARYRTASPVPQLLTFLNSSAVFAIGALAVMQGDLSIGGLFAFRYLAESFLQPMGGLSRLLGTLQEAQNDVDRLDDVLRYPADAYSSGLEEPLQWRPEDGGAKLRGELELRDVSFGYSRNARPLIDHFDLRLEPGSRVALVGGSGSGKSTIARLVTGLYFPTAGQILFDGVPREAIPRAMLTSSMALVDQDVMLFEDSVRANITLWDRTVTDEQLVRAARDAAVHADIAARPGGYDSAVAEGGSNFSGGQRQRLEIARALVQNPTLLVLDEATSALDTTTEKVVMDNLRRRGCSCLVVAHRLSTIRDCDEIIVMQSGAVVERGSHDVLARAGGAYAELIGAN